MLATHPQTLSFEDYLTHDDGTDNRYELVDGTLIPMNPPTIVHFLIVDYLDSQLKAAIQTMGYPWLTLREAGIRTGLNQSRLSDLCIVTKEQVRALQGNSAVFQTPPLLVIEVVSPDSIKRDYRYKRSEYAALGIPEYWIVDPIESKITLLQLEDGFYDETVLRDRQPLCSPLLPDLSLTPEQVWAATMIE